MPRRSVPQFNRLLAELQPAASATGQIDLANGRLGGEPQLIGCGRAAAHDGFAALGREPLDEGFYGRGALAIAALDGQDIEPPPCPQEASALAEP